MAADSHKNDHLFSVHVSWLPPNTSVEELESSFSVAGSIASIYIAPIADTTSKFTYAFVRYKTKAEALNACRTMNNSTLKNHIISVNLSFQTSEKINGSRHKNTSGFSHGKSILRPPFPRLEGSHSFVSNRDEKYLHEKIKASLNSLSEDGEWLGIKSDDDVKDFMKDLKEVFTLTSSIPCGVGVDPVNSESKCIEKSDLEDLIIRYHLPVETRNPFKEIDFDLTENMSDNAIS